MHVSLGLLLFISLTHLCACQVYNVDTLSWTTFTDLPLEYQVSDNAGFSRGTEAFFAGGYSYVYDFYSTVFSIDTEASLGTASLVLSRKADMLATHGDISATTFNDTHAVITGGYGSTLTFCAAEGDVEMYDFATETWSSLPSLVEARGNAVLAEVDGRLLIFGGERPPENICSVESIEPGDRTIAINEVEVLNVDNDTAGWTVLADFPAHRFRAAGVAIKELSQVIIFGGQDAYSNDCQCYRTSDQIVVYEEERPSSSVPSAVPTSVPVPATSTPLTAPPTGAPTSVPRDDSPSSEHSSQPPVLLPSVKPSLLPLTSSLSPSLGSTSRSPSTPAPSTSSGQQTPMVTFTCITVVALLLHCSEHIM